MEPNLPNSISRKRPAHELEPLGNEETMTGKRSRTETPPASAHLTLLEELCDLEDDAESSMDASTRNSSTQEDLVAEMMKSLEKVIEESESRDTGEGSSTEAPSGPASPSHSAPAFDFSWSNEELSSSIQNSSFHGEADNNGDGDFKEDDHIRHLLQASDDELGIPLSSSSSDLDENTFHQEWASLADEGAAVSGFNWLETSFEQFEETASFSRELFEPVILF